MKSLLLILLQCYFSLFQNETREALDFINRHSDEIKTTLSPLLAEEQLIAVSIVAPEISQFSRVMDFMEMRALFIMYRNFGEGDFSVGQFQMKPSFIEGLEKEIRKNKSLKQKYSSYLPRGSGKEQREQRLQRLATLEWQLKYLKLFIDVVKIKTAGIKFKTPKEKLRYWATLYNSGINLSSERVQYYQSRKFFPHNGKKFNYSDVAAEFYDALSSR